jgi:hypothetical protein
MNLRELIEAKQRRTGKLPILVGDPGAVAAEKARLQEEVRKHTQSLKGRERTEEDAAREERLRGELQAAFEREKSLIAYVDVQSLPQDEWDAVVGDLDPDPETGLPDITPFLPELLAASCVDVELQEMEWWAQQLKRPEYTAGEKLAIKSKLFELNLYALAMPPGKG